jgi:hypothetical protein
VSIVARGKVGEAFVEAVVETDGFEEDLDRSLKRAVKEAARDVHWDPLSKAAQVAGNEAGDHFAAALDRSVHKHNASSRFVNLFTNAFDKIGNLAGSFFSEGFAASLKSLPISGSIAQGLVGAVASVASAGPLGLAGLLITLGLLLPVIPLVTSAIFALGGALFSLAGIAGGVPSILAGVLAVVAPLIIAFQGFGEAVAAVASGDIDKINDSLKKLTPSARAVVREIQKAMPFFSQLRKDVQETFFAQFQGAITRLVASLGPTASAGLQNAAFALGGLFDLLAKFAASPQVVTFVSTLFQSITEGISAGGPTLINFLSALVAVAQAALPVLGPFFGTLGGGLDKFSKFLQDKAASGELASFLDSGLKTLQSIGGVLLQVIGLFADMFATTDESGRKFLDDVALAVKQLREFFQSPEGKEFLENMITLAEDFGTILLFIVGIFAGLIMQFAAAIELADDLGDALERLAKKKGIAGDVARILGGPILIPFMAKGGITDGPSIAGEAGQEAVLPLDDPVRARQIAADPMVSSILGHGEMTVIAIFDGEPFQARIVRTVDEKTSATTRQLTQKPRGR